MKHIQTCLLLLVLGLGSTSAFAMKYFLDQDLGIQGNVHLCRYSDGNVYSFRATSLCPLSVDAPGGGMGNGTGFLKGSYVDGMTRVCVYNVMGQQRATRVDSYEICPINQEF